MKCQTILLKQFFGLKGAVYYEAIAMGIFSHVKISSFRAKAHLVFHWCLYNNIWYLLFDSVTDGFILMMVHYLKLFHMSLTTTADVQMVYQFFLRRPFHPIVAHQELLRVLHLLPWESHRECDHPPFPYHPLLVPPYLACPLQKAKLRQEFLCKGQNRL